MSEESNNIGTPPETPQGHWTESNQALSPEMKQSFSKYATVDDALKGGYEAQKMVGKKLENVIQRPGKDAKPEDVTAYQKSLLKELGGIQSEEDLKDFNFAAGLPENAKTDENLVKSFSKFMVENNLPKSLASKLVEFNNGIVAQAMQKQELDFENGAKAADEALTKHYGSGDELKKNDELIRRMFQNNLGLNAEEYEAVAPELAKANFTQNVLLRRALAVAAGKLAGEGNTNTGEGGIPKPQEKSKEEINKEVSPNTYKALGWR